jgi:hypothetical protein
MRTVCLIVAIVTGAAALGSLAADAEEKKERPQVKLLTPAECIKITRRYCIERPVAIGPLTLERSSIS